MNETEKQPGGPPAVEPEVLEQDVVAVPLPAPSPTFWDLVSRLAHADDDLADPNFDPRATVGELRDKVDGIRTVEKRMEVTAEWLRAAAAPIIAKAQALEGNRKRLRAYVVETMGAHKFLAVPGMLWKIVIRDASTPTLDVWRAAEPEDFSRFRGYVTIRTQYLWDEDRIKAELQAGKPVPEGLPARLTRSKWPDFKPNIPEELERKKKPKKVKPITVAALPATEETKQ